MKRGLTLVELLLALALLGVVLLVSLRYFIISGETARLTQARNELQDRIRVGMQLVTGDLQLAGARYWTQGTGALGFTLGQVLVGENRGVQDTLTVRYVTSLRAQDSACRRVDYRMEGETLERSDVNITPSAGTDCLEGTPSFGPLADAILALDIRYICSDGSLRDDPNCPTGTYPRSARVTLGGRTLTRVGPGVRPGFTTVSGQEVACPEGHLCFALTQEVLLPNLKPLQ